MNTFIITDYRYDPLSHRHIVDLEYGYIAEQKQLKEDENRIEPDGVYAQKRRESNEV